MLTWSPAPLVRVNAAHSGATICDHLRTSSIMRAYCETFPLASAHRIVFKGSHVLLISPIFFSMTPAHQTRESLTPEADVLLLAMDLITKFSIAMKPGPLSGRNRPGLRWDRNMSPFPLHTSPPKIRRQGPPRWPLPPIIS